MACAPALGETRPPEKVSYRGKIGPYLVKKEFDTEGELDLYYFGARYYDPVVGFFITPDGMEQYWNSYSYTGGDPINMVDPDGNLGVQAAGLALQMSSNAAMLSAQAAAISAGLMTVSQAISASVTTYAMAAVSIVGTVASKAFLPTAILTTGIMAINVAANMYETWAINQVQANIQAQMASNAGGQAANNANASANMSAGQSTSPGGMDPNDPFSKYEKQVNQYKRMKPEQVQKSIKSLEKQIGRHQEYLRNPQNHIKNWDSLSKSRQQNYMHHWQQDITRHRAYIDIAKNVLSGAL